MYHAQAVADFYANHVTRVPEAFAVNEDALFGISEQRFIEGFRQFTDVMRRVYRDMGQRPQEYGLPIYEYTEEAGKERGDERREVWRAFKRLGDMMQVLGENGKPRGDALVFDANELAASIKKVSKWKSVLAGLLDNGFSLSGYADGKFAETEAELSYPQNSDALIALKAYAISKKFHADDPHEFQTFDYKRVADRTKLPAHCVAQDLAAALNAETAAAFVELNRRLVDELGLTPHYKDDSIEYFLKKKRVARSMIDFNKRTLRVNLKLKDMDRYIEAVESLPGRLRARFAKGNCGHCGFQGATDEHCKFRVKWTLDGNSHEACGFYFITFGDPVSSDIDAFVGLMAHEYKMA